MVQVFYFVHGLLLTEPVLASVRKVFFVVQSFAWAGHCAVHPSLWYCAAKLLMAFAESVLPAVLVMPVLRVC